MRGPAIAAGDSGSQIPLDFRKGFHVYDSDGEELSSEVPPRGTVFLHFPSGNFVIHRSLWT